MSEGHAIPLQHQFDWNEDSVLVFTTHGCSVILQAVLPDEASGFIILEFEGALCVRSASTDCSPVTGINRPSDASSWVTVLDTSNWDDEAHRAYRYIGTPKSIQRRHFVVSNHDVFHEILAESFSEHLVEATSQDYEKIKATYLLAGGQLFD